MGELILYQKIYDFLLYVYPVLAKFPKWEKFALQSQIKNCVLDLERCVIKANKSRSAKVSRLYEADALLEELRMLFRLANDLSEGQKCGNMAGGAEAGPGNPGGQAAKQKTRRTVYISKHQYERVSIKLNEIGKLLGGLIKQVQQSK